MNRWREGHVANRQQRRRDSARFEKALKRGEKVVLIREKLDGTFEMVHFSMERGVVKERLIFNFSSIEEVRAYIGPRN